jgi:outer membrane scaffolding protein for murein synthesis (MipA/OmpV family)
MNSSLIFSLLAALGAASCISVRSDTDHDAKRPLLLDPSASTTPATTALPSAAPGEFQAPAIAPPPAGALAAEQASSMEQALVPLPSVFDFTRGGGFGLALGLGVEYEAAYDGSDEYEFELDPAGAIQWRSGDHMLFFEGTELGWRGVFDQRWLVQAGLRYEAGLDPSDSEDGALDGIEERDSHLVGFVELRAALDNQWRNWVGGRVLAGESDFGMLGVLAAGHRFGDRLDGMGTEVYAFSTFGDSAFLNKDFGVSAEDSAGSGLAQTKLDGGYRSTGLQLVHRHRFTDHLQLIASAGVEFYNSQIGDSPIARDDYESEVSLALVWQF